MNDYLCRQPLSAALTRMCRVRQRTPQCAAAWSSRNRSRAAELGAVRDVRSMMTSVCSSARTDAGFSLSLYVRRCGCQGGRARSFSFLLPCDRCRVPHGHYYPGSETLPGLVEAGWRSEASNHIAHILYKRLPLPPCSTQPFPRPNGTTTNNAHWRGRRLCSTLCNHHHHCRHNNNNRRARVAGRRRREHA